ncbi:conserved Plasmodium protein, unknown function [Plasmodium relictum]|uniref:Pv-fam-g protein n=1 Tax=Plasmodium relictum TaxID=85471 RepID=A0A1J1H8X0_PLARL|nr:conserved Plasmodium protein, unknown function [Plasmodium relictum]CRH01372.1 conserved Plasmodium protein, unknown function [Plasmodium relictum]
MNRSKCRRRSSSKKYKFSSGDSTYCKPIIKNSSHNNDSSEEEIEFEGWIEFVTKKDKNENNTSIGKNKKCDKNRNTRKLSNSPNETILKNNAEKHGTSSKKTSTKNNTNKNEDNSENSYASTNVVYMTPENISNDNIYQVVDSGQHTLFINTQEKRENTLNSLNPIFVDPISPIILKNQQLFPQLYVRQPPTVIVTNEQRPPLVINPPPANVIFKNQSPQPIYVNNARPNIIIKNDPPILQHPINMDTTPIQVDCATENCSVRKEALKFPCSMNIKGGDSVANNKNGYLKGNANTVSTSMPANFIQLDNKLGDITLQTLPNVYMMNDTQCSNFYQTQNSTVSPNNNIIHVQQNPAFNEYETNFVQNIQTPYPQVISQHEQNGNLLNQQAIGNPVTQVISSPTVQTMTPTGVQVMPQIQNFESFANFHTPVTYENNYAQQVAHTTIANGTPQVIHQSPISTTTVVQEQVSNNPSAQFRTLIPTNAISNTTNVVKFQNSVPQQLNVNKSNMQASCAPTQVLSSFPPVGCIPTNKFMQIPSLRRNTYVNPNVNPMYHSPKKVQIIARPMYDGDFRGYNVCR